MSFYGGGQGGNPVVPNQAQLARAAAAATSLQPQLFGQLQFPAQVSQTNPFEQNNHLLLQSQAGAAAAAQGFQNLTFLSEQLAAAGVSQMMGQTTSNPGTNPIQNLIAPITGMTSLNFTSPIQSATSSNVAQSSSTQKQRVFTGLITKQHDNFGFIDDEVFFTTNVVKGPIMPKVGDRVLVEAEFNASAAFKWSATRIQLVNLGNTGGSSTGSTITGNLPLSINSNKGINTSSQSVTYVASDKAPSTGGLAVRTQSHSHGPVPPPAPIISQSIQQQPSVSTSSRTDYASSIYQLSAPQAASSLYSSSTAGRVAGNSSSSRDSIYSHSHGSSIPSLFNNKSTNDGGEVRSSGRDYERGIGDPRDKERALARERERERDKARDREISGRERRRRSPSPPPKRIKSDRSEINDRDRQGTSRNDRDKGKLRERDSTSYDRNLRIRTNPSPASSSHSVSRRKSRSRSPHNKIRDKASRIRRGSEREKGSSSDRRSRSKSRSPSATKRCIRSNVIVPHFPVDQMEMKIMDIKRRYNRLYIPSDFFLARACWLDSFSGDKRLDLVKPSPVLVFRKQSEPIDLGFIEITNEIGSDGQNLEKKITKLEFQNEPDDARKVFTAKVMLLSNVGEPTVYSNNIRRVLNFIVGQKMGKSDVQAIGGPWSESLDGPNPQSDPNVLIRTAIRTTKASVGVDLSSCKTWFRFMELYYRRTNGILETVVFFIPDTTTALPTEDEWKRIGNAYRVALGSDEPPATSEILKDGGVTASGASVNAVVPNVEKEKVEEEGIAEPEQNQSNAEDQQFQAQDVPGIESTALILADEKVLSSSPSLNEQAVAMKEDAGTVVEDGVHEGISTNPIEAQSDGIIVKDEASSPKVLSSESSNVGSDTVASSGEELPTSLPKGVPNSPALDPKVLNVVKLREELGKRGLSPKGLKAQLQIRLAEAIEKERSEEEIEAVPSPSVPLKTTRNDPTAMEVDEVESQQLQETDSSILKNEKVRDEVAEEEISTEKETEPAPVKETLSDILVPLVAEDVDEKTKEKWRRRYSLPKKPHLIIHPIQFGKVTNVDCAKMCLATLREYGPKDLKEGMFEVSLFAEFFNEMLSRDFAYRIYKEAFERTHLLTKGTSTGPSNESEESKEDMKKTNTERRGSAGADSAIAEKVKASTRAGAAGFAKVEQIDDELQMAFTFYDTNRCGFLTESDFEGICLSSGLNLTRAQIRKVTQKIFEKDPQFRYSEWTQNPLRKDNAGNGIDNDSHEKAAIIGNQNRLPVFFYTKDDIEYSHDPSEVDESVIVQVKGRSVDVLKLQQQIEKEKSDKLTLEANLNALGNNMNDAKVQISELKKSSEHWKLEYSKLKESSKASESLLKTQSDELETFRKASERFYDRVKTLLEPARNSKNGNGVVKMENDD